MTWSTPIAGIEALYPKISALDPQHMDRRYGSGRVCSQKRDYSPVVAQRLPIGLRIVYGVTRRERRESAALLATARI
jgi:hypothetical protein